MYRDMSSYVGRGSSGTKSSESSYSRSHPVIDIPPEPAAAVDGLDDDYDYTMAYPHGNNTTSTTNNNYTNHKVVTTPTPTSASARGLQQNQYYQPRPSPQQQQQHQLEEEVDTEYNEYDEYAAEHQNDDEGNNDDNNNSFIPDGEEEMVQYDTTNIIDPLQQPESQYQSTTTDEIPTEAAATTTIPANDTTTLLDLEQLEQLQLEAERLKATGNKHMASQEYVKAYHAYSAALQLSPVGPNSHVYLSNRAAALLSLKRYTAAATDARRAIALAPTFGKAHARLGQALYFLKDYENAVLAYEDAVQYEPDNVVTRAYLEKAEQKLMKQQHQQHHLQQHPDDAMTASISSVMSPKTIQNSVATDPMAHHTIVQQPYQPNSSSARAAFQNTVVATAEDDEDKHQGENEDEVEGRGPSALLSKPSSVPMTQTDVMNNTSKTASGNDETGENNNDPEFIEAVRIQQRANQYLVTKQYRQAIEEYTAALFLVPDDIQLSPDLHLGRAHALNGSRRHESAKNDALLALKIQPNSPAAYSTLAKSLFYLKDYYGAVLAFDQCRAHLPEGESLGLFDQAYLEKAQRALEEEESSLNEAGKPSTPNYMNRSYLSNGSSSSVVPKLPPPRFVPREEAMQQQAITPPARTMPKEWPQQSPTSLNIPLRCGPERSITCISEGLGLKLNRGSDGIVRVLSVTDADDPSTNILRRGTIQIGDIVREAAGVDIRRPITNVMWGDTVALLRMAPRPITIVVASELSPTPKAVLLEQQRAAASNNEHQGDTQAAVMNITPLTRPSPSSGDDAVRGHTPMDNIDVEQIVVVPELAESNLRTNDNVDDEDEDIVECEVETEQTPVEEEIKESLPTLDTITETDDGDENIAAIEGDDDDDDDDDGIESVDDEPSPSSVAVNAVAKSKKSTKTSSSLIDQDVTFEKVQTSLRIEEDKIVGGEILFQRDAPPAYGGWDTLRWMSYNGARKVNFCQLVYKLEDGKRKGLPLFWKSGNKHYVERALIAYDEPNLMMIVGRPTSLDEIRNLLGLPDTSTGGEEASNINDWAINPETAMKSYWILESIADPKTSKLRLSSLTTPTSVSSEGADHRERSCFHILTPAETISLSAVSVRTEAKKQEQSFSDSGAFLETLSLETTLSQTICGAHEQSSDLGNSERDIAWKHQVIIGSLHSLVLSGNPKLLDDGIAHARLALSKGTGNIMNNSSNYSLLLPSRIVDSVDDNGYTALYYACSNKMDSAIRSLVFAGADVHVRTELHGLTMMHLCARKLDDKTLSTILSAMSAVKKLDANVLDKKGRTPMYVAMVEGSVLDSGMSPAALGRCMAALNAWGGYMMPNPTGNTTASSEVLRNPVSALSYMWLSDYLVVVFDHVSYRFPLSMNDKGTTMSLGALYQYPIHSALIALRKNLRKTTKSGVSLSDCGLLPTLNVLLERGFEPNERLDTRAFGTTRTSFDEFYGYAPIHILALMALEMDVYKSDIDAATLSDNMKLLSDTAEILIINGARLSLDPPLPERLREKVSTDGENVEGTAQRRVEIITKKVESDKALMMLLGGDKLISNARKDWCALKKVATMVTMNLVDDTSVFDNSPSAGGSDNLSCAICWSVFGALMNRKHKCRVTSRYVCDECSAKRLVQVCSEYRLSDGQFNLARVDAVNEQLGRKVNVSTAVDRTVTTTPETTSKGSEEARLAVRQERLVAEQQSNRDSLFGGVLEAATNFVMGGDETSTTSPTTSASTMSGLTASLDQTRDAFHQRGERLATLNDKSAKMVDASSDFAKMATELRKQSEKGFFW